MRHLALDAKATTVTEQGTFEALVSAWDLDRERDEIARTALNGVPIDVLADRLSSTRGALYKTLHDARRKLRKHLQECGLSLEFLEETN